MEVRIISYKGLEKVRAERATKELVKEAKKAKKEVEKVNTGKKNLRWSKITRRKSPEKIDTLKSNTKLT